MDRLESRVFPFEVEAALLDHPLLTHYSLWRDPFRPRNPSVEKGYVWCWEVCFPTGAILGYGMHPVRDDAENCHDAFVHRLASAAALNRYPAGECYEAVRLRREPSESERALAQLAGLAWGVRAELFDTPPEYLEWNREYKGRWTALDPVSMLGLAARYELSEISEGDLKTPLVPASVRSAYYWDERPEQVKRIQALAAAKDAMESAELVMHEVIAGD